MNLDDLHRREQAERLRQHEINLLRVWAVDLLAAEPPRLARPLLIAMAQEQPERSTEEELLRLLRLDRRLARTWPEWYLRSWSRRHDL